MELLLWFLFFAVGLGGNCFSKLSSNQLRDGGAYSVFFAINSVIACLFFWVTNGFQLQLDGVTAVFSLLYAVVVLLSLYSQMTALQSIPIAYLAIVGSAANLLLTSLLGVVLFQETFTWQAACRILLMLLASVLLFLERKEKGRLQKFPLLPMTGYVAACAGNYLVLKFYTQVPHQASDSSFFFFTNAFLLIMAVLWLLLSRQRLSFSLRNAIPFIANTLCSNMGSLVSLWLIARTAAVFYNPISSALGTLSVMFASVIFKEKLGVLSCVAACLAIIAVII